MGGSCKVRPLDGWDEPILLWCMALLGSGHRKTVLENKIDGFLKPVKEKSKEIHKEDVKKYKSENVIGKREQKLFLNKLKEKRGILLEEFKAGAINAEKYQDSKKEIEKKIEDAEFAFATFEPDERLIDDSAIDQVYLKSGFTFEGLRKPMKYNNGSLLMISGELSAIFKNFNQYRGGKGSDEQTFLGMYDFGEVTSNTVAHGLYECETYMGVVCGATQPDECLEIFAEEHRNTGRMARFMCVKSEGMRAVLSEDKVIDSKMEDSDGNGIIEDVSKYAKSLNPNEKVLEDLFMNLYLTFKISYKNRGNPCELIFTKPAFSKFTNFCTEMDDLIPYLDEAMSATVRKIKGKCVRIAGLLRCVTYVLNRENLNEPLPEGLKVDGVYVERAIELCWYDLYESKQVYEYVKDNESNREDGFRGRNSGSGNKREVKIRERNQEFIESKLLPALTKVFKSGKLSSSGNIYYSTFRRIVDEELGEGLQIPPTSTNWMSVITSLGFKIDRGTGNKRWIKWYGMEF